MPASEPAAAHSAASLSGSQAEAEPSSGDGGGPGGSWDARTAAARLLKGLMFATFALSAVKILPTLGTPLAQTSLHFIMAVSCLHRYSVGFCESMRTSSATGYRKQLMCWA